MNEIKQITREEFFAIYKGLPKDLKESLFAEETAEKILVIKEKYAIDDSSFSTLVRIIGRVMIGMIEIKNFIQTIVELAQITPQQAAAIAQDINQLIFQPVRESLMAVHGLRVEADTRGSKAPSAQTQIHAEQTLPAPTPIPPPVEPKPVPVEDLEKRFIERQSGRGIKGSNGKKGINGRNGVKGTATAWNGRTIDLTRIPPRRETPSNGFKKNGVRYLDPRDLA